MKNINQRNILDVLDVLRSHIGNARLYNKNLDETITHLERAYYYKDKTSLAWMLTSPNIYIRTFAEEIIKNGDK